MRHNDPPWTRPGQSIHCTVHQAVRFELGELSCSTCPCRQRYVHKFLLYNFESNVYILSQSTFCTMENYTRLFFHSIHPSIHLWLFNLLFAYSLICTRCALFGNVISWRCLKYGRFRDTGKVFRNGMILYERNWNTVIKSSQLTMMFTRLVCLVVMGIGCQVLYRHTFFSSFNRSDAGWAVYVLKCEYKSSACWCLGKDVYIWSEPRRLTCVPWPDSCTSFCNCWIAL